MNDAFAVDVNERKIRRHVFGESNSMIRRLDFEHVPSVEHELRRSGRLRPQRQSSLLEARDVDQILNEAVRPRRGLANRRDELAPFGRVLRRSFVERPRAHRDRAEGIAEVV